MCVLHQTNIASEDMRQALSGAVCGTMKYCLKGSSVLEQYLTDYVQGQINLDEFISTFIGFRTSCSTFIPLRNAIKLLIRDTGT